MQSMYNTHITYAHTLHLPTLIHTPHTSSMYSSVARSCTISVVFRDFMFLLGRRGEGEGRGRRGEGGGGGRRGREERGGRGRKEEE